MGSIVYAGLIIGSVISGFFFSKFSSKIILLSSMIGFLCMISVFIFTTDYNIILISRVFAGIF